MFKLNNYDIIIFSSIDWSLHHQIHHQLTHSLINSGNRVLFVENTGVRSPKFKDFGRILDRFRFRAESTHGFRELRDKLTIYSPIFIPYPYNSVAVLLNTFVISRSIRRWMDSTHFSRIIIISFLPTPVIHKVAKKLYPVLTVYYCADNMSRSLTNPIKLQKSEKKIFFDSDIVLTTSNSLYDYASSFSKYVYMCPAGVDEEKFTYITSHVMPTDIEHLKKPIIGYVGTIGDVFDQRLVVRIAKSLPDATILLIGPKYTDTTILDAYSNIIFLGSRPHENIADYLQSFDVGLIPYVVNQFTDSVYSCKLNEYLAMGVPVVTTNMRETRLFSKKHLGVIFIGKDSDDFLKKTTQILSDKHAKSSAERERRIAVSRENTWDSRFSDIVLVIEERLESKSQEIENWKKNLIDFYSKGKVKLLRKLIVVFIPYLIIFYTPLMWYLGENLIIRDALKQSDAIVVFSGTGESGYNDATYQSRAVDAIQLYKKGYTDKIFLSSGRVQTISEVEIIKLFLVSKGVPRSSIFVLERYPDSTYQNVKMVEERLNTHNIKSILLITSPYHSRRSAMTWEKNSQNIEIIIPEVVSTPTKKVEWSTSTKNMRVILYEYLAIAHNWLVGRI
ncbi:DUF218 domain-containing protein [Candidatus Woesearchaeota archaeon]|jgi:uncharacterized SAM-binding protein YcdF (DUF218 family)/glycosyltransferase involved in cell wall biosynthesis|nr:DUF218 domain-containing protein [Candidatus Woesearchaeota archaeon]